ncbi:hypothetical protein GCM10027088_49680 [Nocardia goodfellowii]
MIEGVKVAGSEAWLVVAATVLLAGGPASTVVPLQPVSSNAAPMAEIATPTTVVLLFIS